MNNRVGLAVAGVIAAVAIILVIIQSGNLSQSEGKLSSVQSTATAQQGAMSSQGTAAVATLSAASTQAAATANGAATAQANTATTAQAKALADAAKAASTMQAQALAAASQAAVNAQASAVANVQNSAATQQAQVQATLKAAATATLGAVVNAAESAQASAVAAAQEAAATTQAEAIQTVQAQATATLGAVIAQAAANATKVQAAYQATQMAAETQIAEAQAQVAMALTNVAANAVQPTTAATAANPVNPTATVEATNAASAIPKDWKRYVGKGVAIQLPKTYIGSELGSDPQALSKMLRALGPDFESAATLLEQNPDILAFIAVDIGGKGGNPSSVIVVSIPMPVKFSMNTLLEATVNQLPGGSKVIEKGIVQVGEYEAGRMIVETHVGSIISTQLQYYIIQNNNLYLVGFTGTPDKFDSQLPAFEQSMKTFEILAKPGI